MKRVKHGSEDGLERTPWFNAREQPPVNGALSALYELRCTDPRQGLTALGVSKRTKKEIWDHACRYCQWRGLTRPSSG